MVAHFSRLGLALLLTACTAISPPATTRSTSDAALARELETIRTAHDVPALGALRLVGTKPPRAAVVGIRAADAEEEVTIDEAWHLGSDTKAMTATLAARLVEQGRIDWDTTIAERLPDLAGEMKPEYRDVTLRQLLAHRGGIVGGEMNPLIMPALWLLEHRQGLSGPQRRIEATRGILAALPVHEPGSTFHYSNAGYIVAGAMLEAAGEAAWEDLMQREVFDPLGMATAGFGPPPAVRGHVKEGDTWQPRIHDNPAVLGPAGTVHASLADWSRFATAHLGHVEDYLSPESLSILHEPVGTEVGGYALGWGLQETQQGPPVLAHAGSNTMWYALIVLDRAADTAYLAACNAPSAEACEAAIAALRDLED